MPRSCIEGAGQTIDKNTIVAKKPCTVGLFHLDGGEETFERHHLSLQPGDKLKVIRANVCPDCGRRMVLDDPRREMPVLVCPACLYQRVQEMEREKRGRMVEVR
jgi:formylmethanofuran dehydrogenase subunit E